MKVHHSSSASSTTNHHSNNGLRILKAYTNRGPGVPDLILACGSVVEFGPPRRSSNSNKKSSLSPSSPSSSTKRMMVQQLVGAIVNAANESCLGGGGVDGAITTVGGPNLARDRRALPLLETSSSSSSSLLLVSPSKGKAESPVAVAADADTDADATVPRKRKQLGLAVRGAPMTAGSDKKVEEEGKEDQENTSTSLSEDAAHAKNKTDIDSNKSNSGDNSGDDSDDDDSEEDALRGPRCRTGSAVITGPGDYGALRVPYVIHAVGPNFWDWLGREREGFARLQSAYADSLHLAAQHNIHHVAFSLLSAGIFRGRQPLARVLAYGIRAVAEWRAVDPNDIDGSSSKASDQCSVQKVYFCAFTERECLCLLKAGRFVMEQPN